MFGWCMTNDHKSCPVKIQKWYHGKKKVGRKSVDAVVMTDEWTECDCYCHKPKPEKPVRKRKVKK